MSDQPVFRVARSSALGEVGRGRNLECRATPPDPAACADPRVLGATYVYLLGLYLGDGCLSAAPRNVWRLRIFQDLRYPELILECARAMYQVSGRATGHMSRNGCCEMYSNWKHWICLLPQHGLGRKHSRSMTLLNWQQRLVNEDPRALLAGLIHSDGSRFINRVRRPTRSACVVYEYPRYMFTNASDDIRDLFADTCRLLGVDCRPTTPRVLSVARRESVALLDSFVGPKR